MLLSPKSWKRLSNSSCISLILYIMWELVLCSQTAFPPGKSGLVTRDYVRVAGRNRTLAHMFSDHTCTWPDMTQWASWALRTFVSAIMGLWCNEELCRTESEGKSMYPYPVCAHMPSSHQTHNKSCYLTHNIANQLWWSVKHCPAFSA